MFRSLREITFPGLLVFLSVSFVVGKGLERSVKCPCNFGGLCLDRHIRIGSCKCGIIGKGIYESDCKTLKNHCKDVYCKNGGTCHQILGGYFCKCTDNHYGQNCEFQGRKLMNEEMYIYYQVQPAPNQPSSFVVIYDPKEKDDLKKYNKTLVFRVAVSDGRDYYPKREFQMERKNWKQICIKSAREFPRHYDQAVCNFLPDKEEWSFEFSPLLGTPIRDDMDDGYDEQNVYDLGTLVGKIGTVEIAVVLTTNSTTGSTQEFLLKYQITVFTYYVSRVPNNCLIDFEFRGCSANPKYPLEVARSRPLQLLPYIRKVNCTGALTVGYRWAIQKHIDDPTLRDVEPLHITDFDDLRAPVFPTRYFKRGTHMIELKLLLKGDPPRFGGDNEFSKIGRCWTVVRLGPVSVRIKYGRSFTTSCFTPLTFNFVTSNPSYYISELQFTISCDHKEDSECAERSVSVPFYTKLTSPCNTIYNFKILVQSEVTEGTNSQQEMEAVVHFIKPEVEMHFECQFNCYPVSPRHRVIAYANSIPYFPDPVKWTIKTNDREIAERDGRIFAFYPLTASRLVLINGYRFSEPGEVRSLLTFEARGIHGFFVVTTTFSDNLHPYLQNFSIQSISNRSSEYRYINTGDLQPYTYVPIEYRISQNNNYTRSSIVILTTNHLSLLYFKADWNEVQLCLLNAIYSYVCTDASTVENTIKTEKDINFLREKSESGDVSTFLVYTVLYLYHGLMDNPSKPLKWKLDLPTRIEVIELMIKSGETRIRDLAVVANAISMICYSTEGNAAEELHQFIDEINEDTKFETMLSWMEMRKLAMKVFSNAAGALFEFGGLERPVLLRYTYGDPMDEMFHAWSLAHVQSNFVKEFEGHIHSAYQEFLYAELDSVEKSIDKLITIGIHKFMMAMARLTRTFYGLRTLGRHNTRGWIITTSYRGILVSLNKSIVRDHEVFEGYTDYIFGPPQNATPWFEYTQLKLPKPFEELDSDEFSLVVLMAKNRPDDVTVSPFLYLRLMRKGGIVMQRIPRSKVFSVTLPKMVRGKIVLNAAESLSHITLVKSKNESLKYHHYSVYKVTLPTMYDSWVEFTYVRKRIPLKLIIKFGNIPDYEEVESMPELKFEHDEATGFYKAANIAPNPQNGSSISGFYLGLVLPKEFPPDIQVTVFQHSDVNVCVAHETDGSYYTENCKGVKAERIKIDSVTCHCKMFGMIYARSLPIRRTRILMDPIEFIAPEVSSHDETDFIPSSLALFAIVTLIVAFFIDRRREKVDLICIGDAYPGDKNLLVVGVYTSVRVFAGTSSTVTIKIVGVESSSRVHLLRTRREKRLRTGHDDWFVIPTKVPLGKITEIIIWHNFHHLSDWHCYQIYIYDLSISKWYHVNVERWFCVHPSMDDSKVVSFKMQEIESVDGVFLSVPYKFSTHYINELRNRHILLSLFYLRRRSLTSVEHRSYVILIQLLAICFVAWFAEEYLTILVYGRVLDPEAAKGLLTLNSKTVLLAFFIVILSAPFTLPIQLAFRSNYKSRLLQKKITNPIYIQLAKPEDLVTTSSQHPKAEDVPVSPQVKKVGFRLTESDVAFRRVTRLLSSAIQKRIAWTKAKATLGTNWKKFFLTFWGPAQFRCVNISSDIFKIKTRRRMLKIRIFAACIMVVLLLTMFLVLNLTHIYGELEVVGFFVLLALVLDIFILDPLYIFFHSLWMIYVLQTSNKESYLWNEDAKCQPPTPLEFVQYSKTATKKEYKPLITDDIEKKIKLQHAVSTVKAILFYGCSLFAIICATKVLDHEYSNDHYYTNKGIEWQIAEPENQLRRQGYHVDEVDTPGKVKDYIATSLAAFVLSWYNKQNISNYHRGRWARDLVSKPIGASNMIILFIPRGGGDVRTKKIINDYFEYAAGFVTERNLATDQVTLGGIRLSCMNKSVGWIIGKTHDHYPMRGHNLTLQLVKFQRYYSTLINVLDDLLEDMHINIPRAIIYTTNYINTYARRIITVDAIHEFLPSGVSTAKIQVNTVAAYGKDQRIHEYFSNALIFLVFIHFILTVNEVVKHESGIILYFLSLNGILKLVIYPLCISLAISELTDDGEAAVDTIINLSDFEYVDLHHVYQKAIYEAVLVLTMLSSLILDTFFAIWRKCGYDRLKQTMTTRCIHLCGGLFVMQLYIFLNLNVCANSMDTEISSLEVSLLLKEGNTIETEYSHLLLITIYITLFVFQKTTAAVFLANYFVVERQLHQESTLKQALAAMRLFPKKTSINKNRESKSRSKSTAESGGLNSVDSSHSFRNQQPKKYNIFW